MSSRIWLLRLAFHSLRNRLGTALLTLSTIAISVALLLGVHMVRNAARESFENTLSGTDLIVGARTGSIDLLLLSVFRIGDADTNVSWETYQKIAHHPDVAWTIPISLGDMHRGFRVLGTNGDYFLHYRYNAGRPLAFAKGGPFHDLFDAVVGADVARKMYYDIGTQITLSHGTGAVSFVDHADKPFHIVGILAPTGTPVDRTVHVSLEAISAMHADWQGGTQAPKKFRLTPDEVRKRDLTPDSVTAFLVGMRSKVMTFTMQRAINTYRQEPLLAILPGVTLTELWNLVGVADTALIIVSAFVVAAGLLGMMTSILAGLNERRREMAILRSVGARAHHVFTLLVTEAGLLALAGTIGGIFLCYALVAVTRTLLGARLGIDIAIRPPSSQDIGILIAVIASALLVGMIPAFRAYRNTLSDGLQLRT
jgi:putative ABC transport system permease protein